LDGGMSDRRNKQERQYDDIVFQSVIHKEIYREIHNKLHRGAGLCCIKFSLQAKCDTQKAKNPASN